MEAFLILFGASLLGLFAHAFKKIDEERQDQKKKGLKATYNIKEYFSESIYITLFTLVCLFVLAYAHDEIKKFKELTDVYPIIGVVFYFCFGYVGDSAFPPLLNLFPKLLNKIFPNKKEDEK